MGEPKWTPGPWGVTTRRGSWDWVVYTEADSNIEICQPFHDGTDENEIGEANAHLVAAAPDLYDTLERFSQLLRDEERLIATQGSDLIMRVPSDLFRLARAATNKARGDIAPNQT